MKKKIFAFFLCLLILCIPTVQAQAENDSPWYYEIRDGGVFILNYRGDHGGHVEIPATIDGKPVTGIGNSAFLGRKLSSVTIPDTVTQIVDAAFAHCPNLSTVNLSENVTVIDGSAFMDCESLTGIWVDPQNPAYTSDDQGVVYTKNERTLVQAPGALEGEYVIPDGVIEIGHSAFQGCWKLTKITIADSVRHIDGYAFCDCSGLTRLAIPALVESIGLHAFTRCSKLTGIDVAKENRFYCSDESGNLYNQDKSQILYGAGAFTGDYVVPQGTTQIGNSFFNGASGLTSVTIPEGVTFIGHYAFHDCENLESVTIAQSVRDIDGYAFQHCPKLTKVNIPAQMTHIQWGLFCGCESLTQLPIHNQVKIIDDYAFQSCHGLTDIIIPASVEYVGHYAFQGCRGLKNVYFCGDAPEFVNHENINGSFADTAANAYYHKGTEGWTAENMSKTGGYITWNELEHIVFDEGPDARCVVCGEKAQKNTTVDGAVYRAQLVSDETTDVPTIQNPPTTQNPPTEDNPKTKDRIIHIAGIVLILVTAGFWLTLKLWRCDKQ